MRIPSSPGKPHLILRSLGLLVLTAGVFLVVGCDSGGSNEPPPVSGKIVNVTGQGVENAELEFTPVGSSSSSQSSSSKQDAVATTTTGDDGSFEVGDLSAGEYNITISSLPSGPQYADKTVQLSFGDDSSNEPSVTLQGDATIQGTIANASTGGGITEAEAAFTFVSDGTFDGEVDTSRTEADLIVETNDSGEYSISNAPTGNYICVVRADGFSSSVVEDLEFNSGTNDLGQTSTSETLAEGQIRLVLEWGQNPSDLDSHLTGPDGQGGRFHVYYIDQEYPADSSTAFLDVDDVTSFGPETTTINTLREGTYRYSVFNFSNSQDDGAVGIDNSPAKVTVFDSDGQRATYSPPPASDGDGNTWRVLEIEVSGDGSVTFRDNGGSTLGYFDASDSGDLTTFTKDKQTSLSAKQKKDLKRVFDRPSDSF